ncbi:MAG TPA: hypothetical protein VN802_13920 [Stellaceae bacterium]|nr:hypothetical protein [Stellaceae bacterium]
MRHHSGAIRLRGWSLPRLLEQVMSLLLIILVIFFLFGGGGYYGYRGGYYGGRGLSAVGVVLVVLVAVALLGHPYLGY